MLLIGVDFRVIFSCNALNFNAFVVFILAFRDVFFTEEFSLLRCSRTRSCMKRVVPVPMYCSLQLLHVTR